jgi:tetratricopeptide (TPR) repeat protein
MDQVVVEHPANPEVYGRKAQLLFQNGRAEEAENTLQKAFEIRADYPFGHLLRGIFRFREGEVLGALVCFRKAADAYDPEARDLLAQVHGLIAEAELKLNRPVACRAALRISLHCQPNQPDLRQQFDNLFGPQSPLPASARQEYKFVSPAATLAGERRKAWDQALGTSASPRLSDAARAFEQLTQADAEDAAAWYNLGLARAWLGQNGSAIEALDRYVALEADEERAGAAWALAEVLRCGQGLEEQADYVDHSVLYQLRNPEPLFALFQEWEKSRKLVNLQVNEEQNIVNGLVLDSSPVLAGMPSVGQTARIGAHLLLVPGLLHLRFPNKEALDRIRQELEQRVGAGLSEPHLQVSHVGFSDVCIEALSVALNPLNEEDVRRRIIEGAQRYFEEQWIHRPLRSLNRIPPCDAGQGTLRKKLRGVVQFLAECAAASPVSLYDFNRLREKLGLAAAAPAAAATSGPDVSQMTAADLAGLAIDTLSDAQLEQACQAAQKQDALDLAAAFARALVSRPVRAEQPDRWPCYSLLVQRALAAGNTDEALSHLNEGERVDGEANEGRRRNDYELRRGQVLAKRGEVESACEAFTRLIERAPSELKYRGTAAEAMLALRQGARALRFAEEGLARARQQNNRDSEQYFLELAAAARKQVG